MDIIKSIEFEQMKAEVPDLKVGNTVKIYLRIKEGNKTRIQTFEGTIIKIQGSGMNKTFTVRRISYGVGVEKTFLLHSPLIEKIEITRVGKARRARLFYLRDKIGKKAKTKEHLGAKIEMDTLVIKEGEVEIPVTEEETMKEEDVLTEEKEKEAEEVKEESKEEKKEETKVEEEKKEAKDEE